LFVDREPIIGEIIMGEAARGRLLVAGEIIPGEGVRGQSLFTIHHVLNSTRKGYTFEPDSH
jgi:hypothetical protein